MKRTTRAIRLIAIFVTLGAIVNVLVAWGCALSSQQLPIQMMKTDLAMNLLRRGPGGDANFGDLYGIVRSNRTVWRDTIGGFDTNTNDWHCVSSIRAGLPLNTLTGYHMVYNKSRWCEWAIPLTDDSSPHAPVDAAMFLPLKPLLPSFVINSLFYAILVAVLMLTPVRLRRVIRRLRHRCVKCGYPLSVPVAGCPECGWGRAEANDIN